MIKEYKNIAVFEETSLKFEKLQLDLKAKKILKTKDELMNILMNTYKEYQKIKAVRK